MFRRNFRNPFKNRVHKMSAAKRDREEGDAGEAEESPAKVAREEAGEEKKEETAEVEESWLVSDSEALRNANEEIASLQEALRRTQARLTMAKKAAAIRAKRRRQFFHGLLRDAAAMCALEDEEEDEASRNF